LNTQLLNLINQEAWNQPICFRANFKDEVNGVDGFVSLKYNDGLISTTSDVEVNFTQNDVSGGCTNPQVSLNSYWNYEPADIFTGLFPQTYKFGAECSEDAIGKHYDPYWACNENSQQSEACALLQRTNTDAIAVGDISLQTTPFDITAGSVTQFNIAAPIVSDWYFRTNNSTWASVNIKCIIETTTTTTTTTSSSTQPPAPGRRRLQTVAPTYQFCAQMLPVDCVTGEVIEKVQATVETLKIAKASILGEVVTALDPKVGAKKTAKKTTTNNIINDVTNTLASLLIPKLPVIEDLGMFMQ